MNHKHRNLTLGLIILAVLISLSFSIFTLRHNNIRMKELRTAVFSADEAGNEKELIKALNALRSHVLEHMNTDLQPADLDGSEKPVQLPYKYYRDTLEAWYEKLDELEVNSEILDKARNICETEDYVISERLNCLVTETKDIDGFPEIKPLSKDFYVYDFPSPSWSPDLAGISLVFFGLSLAVLILRLLF